MCRSPSDVWILEYSRLRPTWRVSQMADTGNEYSSLPYLPLAKCHFLDRESDERVTLCWTLMIADFHLTDLTPSCSTTRDLVS